MTVFHIFSEHIYLLSFLRHVAKISIFYTSQNALYFINLYFLVHKIFTFYTMDVPKFKFPALGPKG